MVKRSAVPAISIAVLFLSGCTTGAEADACREILESALDAPSTISRYDSATEDVLLHDSPGIGAASCAAIGWPKAVCTVLVKDDFPWAGGILSREEEELRLAKLRRAKDRAFAQLTSEQRLVTRVSVEFDASNSFGTPIRHEATCDVRLSRNGGKPVVIDVDFVRGF